MLKRLQQILVDSYVGAFSVALLFAQAIGHFATMLSIFTTNWLLEGPYRASPTIGFRIQSTAPELVRGLFLLLICALLLYWLYFPASERLLERTEQAPELDEQSGKQ